jgi:16S rRNA (cytidine1402-2'-O)-methyltransferase
MDFRSSLYLVPTPVGNLGDITVRALEVLKTVDKILAEDTRTTGQLLKHYGIKSSLASYHMHNEHKAVETYINEMLQGKKIALVTDAGTPGISDPGYLIVKKCIETGVMVECLPGATAFVPALVVSGLPTDRFVFEGFLPNKKGRNTRLKALEVEERTMVFYESPHKLVKTLEQFCATFGNTRPAAVVREVSKKFEESIRGPLETCCLHFKKNAPRGEFVIVVQGKI